MTCYTSVELFEYDFQNLKKSNIAKVAFKKNGFITINNEQKKNLKRLTSSSSIKKYLKF